MRRPSRLLALLAAIVLAACGGGSSDQGGPRSPTSEHVRVAVGEDIWPLTGQGPSSKHFAAGDLSVGVYEPLLSLAPDFTLRPGLAERWELVDPLRWRFHLRQGVRFHDGRPFGADDVVWSWTGRQFLSAAVTGTLASVVKVDDHTVDFMLSVPNLRLPEQLVHPEGPIVPRNGHNDATPPVGTGPFRVVDYRPRQRVVVERFDDYWGEKAKVRRITFQFLPGPEDRLEALRSGDVDVAANLEASQVTAVESDGRLRVVAAPRGATHTLSFETPGPDRDVRRAVALALDRDAYVAAVLKGNGDRGRAMAPPAVLGTAAATVTTPSLDPTQAIRVLDDAGWVRGGDGVRVKDGRRLTLVFIGGQSVPEAGLRFVQQQLQPLGIEVAVKRATDRVTLEEYRQKGYDLELTMPNQNDANPAFLPTSRASDELVAAARTAESREAAQRVSAQMMQVLINEEFQVVPLAHVSRLYAMRQGIDLPDPHPSAISQSWAALTVAG